jgi:riboflavin-specific deaminase-like protein
MTGMRPLPFHAFKHPPLFSTSPMLSKIPLYIFIVMLTFCLGEVATSSPSDIKPPKSSVGVQGERNTLQVITDILEDVKSWQEEDKLRNRPFITLTFAQSLDGKIALKETTNDETSSNLPLSGKESLLLTHGLRSIHDAILVGGKTLSTDNPRLNNRLWGETQPRPVVLDTRLEHVRKLGASQRAQDVIVCCNLKAAESFSEEFNNNLELLPCQCDADGRLVLGDVLERLQNTYGIRSVMVEGGASVHSAFLSERLVDCLCITIAPKVLGNDRGLACFSTINGPENTNATQQDYIDLARGSQPSHFVPLGSDCIYICQWPHDNNC